MTPKICGGTWAAIMKKITIPAPCENAKFSRFHSMARCIMPATRAPGATVSGVGSGGGVMELGASAKTSPG